MKLKNFLGILESNIARYLRNHEFVYNSYNYSWERSIDIICSDIYNVTISCDLDNKKLKINQLLYTKKYESKNRINTIDIPKELIEKDDPFKFINWLDEVCEPYL